jgi:hypothetical protein
MAMSSTNDNVRCIAYQMIDQFYVMVEHARFKEQPSVIFVLEAFKNSITGRADAEVPPRVPSAIAVCVAHALSILLHPEHFMLPHISTWILQNPTFDFNVSYDKKLFYKCDLAKNCFMYSMFPCLHSYLHQHLPTIKRNDFGCFTSYLPH